MSGKLFIVAAPSGAGKTSLVHRLLTHDPEIHLSVSYTTRAARPGETNGRDYRFVSPAVFDEMRSRGEFLESAEVHGNLYGTSRSWIENEMRDGKDILLEIDWQGARQVRKLVPEAVSIFILPPSVEVLAQRLSRRGTDTPEVIERRLQAARNEISHLSEFDYVIINKDFEQAAGDIQAIVRAERLRTGVQLRRHSEIINRMK